MIYSDLELVLLFHLMSMRHLQLSSVGVRLEDLAVSLGILDCTLGAWTSGMGSFFKCKDCLTPLDKYNLQLTLHIYSARAFAAFTVCHINPYSSANVWRGYFGGPLGENTNGISRGNALKDEWFVFLAGYFRNNMLLVRVTSLNTTLFFFVTHNYWSWEFWWENLLKIKIQVRQHQPPCTSKVC